MEVNGQLHAPAALPPGKEALVPIGQEAGWNPEPFWTWWWREKFPGLYINIISDTHWFTLLLPTAYSRVLCEKQIMAQLGNKFYAFHGTRMFNTVLTKTLHLIQP
jgi:hypothetical protein